MKRIIIFCVLVSVLVACSKDKFKTEPQVEIKSFGPSEVHKGEVFSLRATVRDNEGDLQDSLFLIRKRWSGTTLLSHDTIPFRIADFNFPDNKKIEIQALFSYGELKDNYLFANLESQDRQFSLGVIVRDKAGHKSSYVESDKIVLKKL
jgi:hypothetical protein